MTTTSKSSPTLSVSELNLLLSLSASELEAWLTQLPESRRRETIVQLNRRLTEIEWDRKASDPDLSTPGMFALSVSKGRWRMARHLELLDRLVLDAITGRGSKRLIVTMPPRHGKSEHCSHWTPAWYVGSFPDKRVILTSYEANFAESWGGKARTTLERFGHLFNVKVRGDTRAKSAWQLAGYDGGMQTAGAAGAITGKGADLLLCDDPIKNAEEAASETRRNAIWEWWQSTAYTRLEPDGVAIVIQTRWHEDDLAGRLIASSGIDGADEWIVVNLPAICEEPGDPLGRRIGEALWPERYSANRLNVIRASVGSRVWGSLYQQRPFAIDGDFFHREWFPIVPDYPKAAARAVLYWDKASTDGGGDYSAGVLMCEHNGIYYIVDAVRGQWSPRERNVVIAQTSSIADQQFDDRLVIWVEEEGGSGGKESAEISTRELAGFRIKTERVSGSKSVRAQTLADQAEAGNVRVVRGPWNKAFLDELCAFPRGANDDQVDGASGAFRKLARKQRIFAAGAA